MPLITKKSFIDLITQLNTIAFSTDIDKQNHYVGMGEPNSDLLLIGNEMALDSSSAVDKVIFNHECTFNINHWYDIYTSHIHLTNALDPSLLGRIAPLTGFNPHNPLLFSLTRTKVFKSSVSGHTYSGMERLIDKVEKTYGFTQTNIKETINWDKCSFSKFFITELNINPSKTSSTSKFNVKNFVGTNKTSTPSERYNFMNKGDLDFYKSFKTVIIYAGSKLNYVGKIASIEREKIIQIFNPALNHGHHHIIILPPHVNPNYIEYYDCGEGSRVILSRHFSSGFSNSYAHELAKLIR